MRWRKKIGAEYWKIEREVLARIFLFSGTENSDELINGKIAKWYFNGNWTVDDEEEENQLI